MDAFATRRLTAERLSPAHLDDLVRLHLDPEVSRFLGGVRSADSTTAYLARNLTHWDEHGFGLWVLRTQEGAFAGRAGVRYIALDGERELEIAYTFTRDTWGRGLATEISQALVDFWRERLDHPSLVGVVDIGHAASERVLNKCGFRYERRTAHDGEAVSVFRLARPHGPGAP